jgi:hypothetical protein
MEPGSKVIRLQHWLKEHAPHLLSTGVKPRSGRATGIDWLDQQLQAGLPEGSVSEWERKDLSTGMTALLLQMALQQVPRSVAWVDLDQLDPASVPSRLLPHLLWVRAGKPADVIRAGDLLLRDGNFPVVVLDVSGVPVREVRRIPASHWHRLSQVARHHGSWCWVMTPAAVVGSAALRLRLAESRPLEDVERCFLERVGGTVVVERELAGLKAG